MFYLEAAARIQGITSTYTQESCQWIIPSNLKEVEYLPVEDINFTSARGMKRTLDGKIKSLIDSEERDVSDPCVCEKSKKIGSRSTEADLTPLYQNLSVIGTKPGLLSVVPAHSEQFVPISDSTTFNSTKTIYSMWK